MSLYQEELSRAICVNPDYINILFFSKHQVGYEIVNFTVVGSRVFTRPIAVVFVLFINKMTPKLNLCIILLVVCSFTCCTSGNRPGGHVFLDRLSADNTPLAVNAHARCIGPQGAFNSRVRLDSNNDLHFHQDYLYSGNSYEAFVSDALGYSVDSESGERDTFGVDVIQMLRTHVFHQIYFKPQMLYDDFQFFADSTVNGQGYNIFIAKDQLSRDVRLFIKSGATEIEMVQFKNQLNPDEVIFIQFIEMGHIENNEIQDTVLIVQGGRDSFMYFFDSVDIEEYTVDSLK